MNKLGLALLLTCLGLVPAQAQNFNMPPPAGVSVGGFAVVATCGAQSLGTTTPGFGTMDTTGKICTSGTSSGSGGGGGGAAAVASGFVPNLNFATLTATGSSASVALPAGVVVELFNLGTSTVSCTLGVGSATATAGELIIPANSPIVVVVGANTFGACIDQTGTASNQVVLAGGSISNGTSPIINNATLATWNTATGTTSVDIPLSGTVPNVEVDITVNGTVSAGQITIRQLNAAGSYETVPVDQSLNQLLAPQPPTTANPPTPGLTKYIIVTQTAQLINVQLNSAIVGTGNIVISYTLSPHSVMPLALNNPLAAGSAIVGTVGIDQTTQGTTNRVTLPSQYPFGATAITASATGTTAATTATLAGVSNKTTYICGYSIRANATAATTVTNTITGVITATMSHVMWVAPLASGIGVDEQVFSPCIPASGTNTGIAIVSGAPGSGGTVSSTGWGYQL